MRNYFVQIQELRIAEARLDTLIEKRIRLKNKIRSCTKELKDNLGSSSFSNDKMAEYMINLEKIELDIEELKEEIECLKHNLGIMEQALKEIKDVEQEIFLLRYRDNLKVKQIARKVGYSIPRVYQFLDEINLIIHENTKDYKKL